MHIVHSESSCGWGGQELRIIEEARGMIARGHEVCIAAPPQARIYAEAQRRGVTAHALPIARKGLRGWLALRRFLARRRPDIVNSHSSTDSWLAALALWTLSRAPRLVRTRHISAPIARNIATRWLYGCATARVVTTGERLREQVVRETGLDPERVVSIRTGIDLARFVPGERQRTRAQLQLPPDAFIIGIVATLRSWKGHRDLLDALAGIDDPRLFLAIVGAGPGEDNLRAQIKALGLEARVRMPGHQDDVVPWLQALDAFVLPSYANEGVPQAIMQAMACRIPVVTTPVGAIGEIVRDEQTGLMVAPRDIAALRAAILRLRDDAPLRQRLARSGFEFARVNFAAAIMLDDIERVFIRVAGRA